MDISVLCRSCMKELAPNDSTKCNEKQPSDKLAVRMFCFCTDIKISKGDRLPHQFCSDCHKLIYLSYKFIKEAQKVNITLKNLLARSDAPVIIDMEKINCKLKTEFEIDEKTVNNNAERENRNAEVKNYDSKIDTFDESMAEYLRDESTTEVEEITSDINKSSNEKLQDLSLRHKNYNDDIINQKYLTNTVRNLDATGNTKCENSCPICYKKFKRKIWLTKHKDKAHMKSFFKCKECPKTFTKQCDLNSHSTTHTSPTTTVSCVACACGEQFASHRQLAEHARTHENALAKRPYICDYCAASYKTKSHLQTHINMHTRASTYLCYTCGSSFYQLSNLKSHMVIHSSDKPFACESCAFATNSAVLLRRHRRRRHEPNTALTHRCPHCDKTFFDSAGLARHIRRHTGDRPYKCGHCGRGFIDSWKRKVHLMRRHKMLLSELKALPKDPGAAVGIDVSSL